MSTPEGQSVPPTDSPSSSSSSSITLTIRHHGESHTFTLPSGATLLDLSNDISSTLSIPPPNQKLLISPKPGMLKPPFQPTPLSAILSSSSSNNSNPKITLYGTTTTEITNLNKTSTEQTTLFQARQTRLSTPTPRSLISKSHPTQSSLTYTFHTLTPLPHLPNPSRSLAYLTRLRNDPGIRATMSMHHFSVPLLTEMDPAAHTTHDSRTLGLNRNKGEVIELRLRTDAYDGYRDYRTIRKTLCHELAHCVHSEHDRHFWALTKQIEDEVEKADWRSGGRSVGGDQEFYNPREWEESQGLGEAGWDHGGWTGGEFVLGGGGGGNGEGGVSRAGLSRREILAQAAEQRARREKAAKEQQQQQQHQTQASADVDVDADKHEAGSESQS